tara:strand:- start:6335 stop:6538 length:204 start_codon:yes stop_codon:yes gene_type:complete
MINLRLCLALIYLGNHIVVWNILKRPNHKNTNNKYIQYKENGNEKNKTHTFLDDDEFMQILRFYRPI